MGNKQSEESLYDILKGWDGSSNSAVEAANIIKNKNRILKKSFRFRLCPN